MGNIEDLKKNKNTGMGVIVTAIAGIFAILAKQVTIKNKLDFEYKELDLQNQKWQNKPFGKFTHRNEIETNIQKMQNINERKNKL